jgi:hypothetical protein
MGEAQKAKKNMVCSASCHTMAACNSGLPMAKLQAKFY